MMRARTIRLLVLVLAASLAPAARAAAQTASRAAAAHAAGTAAPGIVADVPARAGAAAEAAEAVDTQVRAAIIEAVHARMGGQVEVTLRAVRVRGVREALPARLAAVPDVGAQTGGAVRFLLFDGAARGASARARRLGSVDAQLFVSAPHLQARAAIERGAAIAASDVEPVAGDVGRHPLKPLPAIDDVAGARATRAIAAGEALTASMLVRPPLVRSGDEVQTRVRIGGLEARGQAVAAQDGALGDDIVLVNADSRRRLKGRVIGAREVEVLHEK